MDIEIKNLVRVGIVSSVNESDRTVRVIFKDKNGLISGPLKVIKNLPPEDALSTTKSWLPKAGDLVLCLYLPNGKGDGFVIGGI